MVIVRFFKDAKHDHRARVFLPGDHVEIIPPLEEPGEFLLKDLVARIRRVYGEFQSVSQMVERAE